MFWLLTGKDAFDAQDCSALALCAAHAAWVCNLVHVLEGHAVPVCSPGCVRYIKDCNALAVLYEHSLSVNA